MFYKTNLILFLYVFIASFGACIFLVLTKAWHLKLSLRREDGKAVQAAHRIPTPRIGGVGIILGTVFSIFLMDEDDVFGIGPIFAISIIPVFFAGLLEDLGVRVRPRDRLLAAGISSALAIAILQIWVTRVDVPILDMLFSLAPIAIIFTIFATAGICHAFNLIDGLNGLASATAIVTAAGLAAISARAGFDQLSVTALLFIAAFLGFLVLNFPLGKIFLGDAGAYSIGHVLSWLSIVLMFYSPEVTPWAVVLIFFWPLADTCFSIYRRKKSGKPTGLPDRLHHHQLVMRGLEITVLGRGRRQYANPLATLCMLPMIAAPVITGAMLWNNTIGAILGIIFFGSAFAISYRFGLYLIARRGRRMMKNILKNKSLYRRHKPFKVLPNHPTLKKPAISNYYHPGDNNDHFLSQVDSGPKSPQKKTP